MWSCMFFAQTKATCDEHVRSFQQWLAAGWNKNIYSDYSGVRVKIKYVQTIVTVWYDIIGKIFFENFNKNQCILTAIGQLHAVFCISCIVGFSRAPAGVIKWTSITPNPLSFLMREQSHYKALKNYKKVIIV